MFTTIQPAVSHLQTNLAALGARNADVAQKIASAAAHPNLQFIDTPQGVPAGVLDGKALCSRHRPLDEADRLVEGVDLLDHAVFVALGFGMGYHVQRLAERLDRNGVIVVFEPDFALLRAVLERVDHSRWLRNAVLAWCTDADDHAALATKLQGGESIVVQGVTFLSHPPSRARLGRQAAAFSDAVRDHVTTSRTTLMTTLMRSIDTVRNLLGNVDHYVGGAGIADLANAAAGVPAVVVSAGPSLQRNMARLAEPGVRDRCIIIAVQTTLKPLLAAGIRPHFVTALDYHEISQRFYEDLDPEQVRDVTLVAEPKVHPSVIDAYPGPVRCCGSQFLDQLLGDLRRPMGDLPSGATVAHLSVYLARFLGCNPVTLIGQDLAFPDGLYYAPGTAIDEIWSPELNHFNTMEMMQWQRIVRHRRHLHRVRDRNGREIYTDAQMLTYLHQFERDFASMTADGLTVLDATEGGAAKQHTTAMPLHEALSRYATRPIEPPPLPASEVDPDRLRAARARVQRVRAETLRLQDLAQQAKRLTQSMLEAQHDAVAMKQRFKRLERLKAEVNERFEAFQLLNSINQLGVFKRMKADRQLNLSRDLAPLERQRGELQRDVENVRWIADAAEEFASFLHGADRVLAGERARIVSRLDLREAMGDAAGDAPGDAEAERDRQLNVQPRLAAMVPLDPQRTVPGATRPLDESLDADGPNVLQSTLQRLGCCARLESIILIVPDGFDIEPLIDRGAIGRPVEIVRCDDSPFGVEAPAIGTARAVAPACWRGGVGGMSAFDEVLCPEIMHEIMQQRGLTAALLAGPDWPLLDTSRDTGCEALIERHLEHPSARQFVFTQAPPGLGACIVGIRLMTELARRTRLSTIGGTLTYQPHLPQHDPIARDVNVQVPREVRRAAVRAMYDTPRRREVVRRAWCALSKRRGEAGATDVVAALRDAEAGAPLALPQHVILEITTERRADGAWARQSRYVGVRRPAMTVDTARALFQELAQRDDDVVVTLAGAGDPLLHPQWRDIAAAASDAGLSAVHVRTTLPVERDELDGLLNGAVDIVTVELHADRAATYGTMMGEDRFREVLEHMQYLIDHRQRLTRSEGTSGLAVPWIVPALRRCAITYDDLEPFYDRWQHALGAVALEGVPPFDPTPEHPADELAPAVKPISTIRRQLASRMIVTADGRVPISELDVHAERIAGTFDGRTAIADLWRDLLAARTELWESTGDARGVQPIEPLRTFYA